MPKERLVALTPEWKGERFPDGRIKVIDNIMKRMKNISLEQVWSVLRSEGYAHQFEGHWEMIQPRQGSTEDVTLTLDDERIKVRKLLEKKGQTKGELEIWFSGQLIC